MAHHPDYEFLKDIILESFEFRHIVTFSDVLAHLSANGFDINEDVEKITTGLLQMMIGHRRIRKIQLFSACGSNGDIPPNPACWITDDHMDPEEVSWVMMKLMMFDYFGSQYASSLSNLLAFYSLNKVIVDAEFEKRVSSMLKCKVRKGTILKIAAYKKVN